MSNPVPASSESTAAAKPSERGFWFFVALQFQNAFSDSVFKQFIIFGLVAYIWKDAAVQSSKNAIVAGTFIFPPILFSTWSGFLADKFSKRKITLATKVMELVLAIAAFFALRPADPHTAFVACLTVLFFFGAQAALFSPSKYGIIPELVRPERLAWANGVIELTTFVSIITGTASATLLLHYFKTPDQFHKVGIIMIVLSIAGFLAGLGIDRTRPANPARKIEVNFIPELLRYFRLIRRDRRIGLTILGLSYFWALGSILLTQVNVWGEHALGLSAPNAGLLFVGLSLGIGFGALAAGYLSRGRIELGLVPLGGFGLTLFCLIMAFASPGLRIPMYVALAMVGLSAGFFSLPLNAVLQHDTAIEDRGGILAANNFFNSIAMFLSAGFMIAFNGIFHPNANRIFLVLAAGTLIATIVLMHLLPEAFLRFVAFIFTCVIYRTRTRGLENIPATGPALIVANHTAFIDPLLIMAVSPRPVRFLSWQGLFDKPVLGWVLRQMRCIPIGSTQRPRELIKSLRTASDALNGGEVLCVFAEGEITRTGAMLPFRRGYEYILKNAPDVPIVPMYLNGVWGSIFSFEGEKFFWKWPRQIPYRVHIAAGSALPHDTPPWKLRQAIAKLGADSAIAAKDETLPLQRQFVRNARRYRKNFFAVDQITPPVTLGQALWRAIILARRLRPLWGDQETIGIFLPPSVGAALVNIAAALSGRCAVNLNYTTGAQILAHCAHASGLKTIITARAFVEKVKLELPADIQLIYIEEHSGKRGMLEPIAAILASRYMPVGLLEGYCGARKAPSLDDLATIIFSSGSTGTPKGVMLSHFNIMANIESFRLGVRILPEDRLLGTLPFFHSFGYTVSLWGSLVFPFGMVFHLNPLDVKTVGDMVEQHKVTIIITTPTFLTHYMKRIPPAQFGGVNMLVTGAEKLQDSLRDEFREKFGIEPLQGFGTTELAPVVSANISDFRAPGLMQLRNKPGSVGQALPTQVAEIRHAETGEVLPPGEAGLLWVRGANVMQGYLGMPEKTAEVIQDGWYNTGDMAKMDEDGFIFITGRLSRFSKIGGEMVPHGAIEEKLHEVLGIRDQQALVVTGVPDEAKGEKLIVLHTLNDEQLAGYNDKLAKAGVPNLWIPRKENFKKIEAIPILGTGKLDLQKVNEMAKELAQAAAAAQSAQSQ